MNQKREPSYRELRQRLALEEARLAYIKQALRVIRQANQLILHENNPKRLIERACTILTETPGYHSAWLALLDQAGVVTTTASSGFKGGFDAMRHRLERDDFPARVKQTLEQEEMVVVNEPPADCPLGGDYAGRAGLTRRLAYGGRVYGILAVSVPAAYTHDAEAQELFDELAGVLACALHKIETEAHRHRLEQIITTIPHPMALVSRDYRFLAVNDVYAEFYGAAQKQILGRTVADFHGQARFEADIKPQLDRCLAGEAVRYEIQVDFPGQGKRWMEMEYYPYRDEGGQVTGVVAHGRDITERKQAEAALRDSEEKFRGVIEQSADGIALADHRGLVAAWNQAHAQMTGLEPAEVIGRPIWEALYRMAPGEHKTPALLDYLQSTVIEASNTGRAPWLNRLVERESQHPDGTRRILQSTLFPIKTSRGFAVGNITRDVTDLKRAEDELRESEERFRDIVSSVPGAVYQFLRRPNGAIEIPFMSQGAGLLFNRSLEELQDPSRLFEDVHPDDLAGLWSSIEESAQTMSSWQREFRIVSSRGETKWLRGISNPRELADGSICWFGVLLDVTEQKRAEAALRASERRYRSLVEQSLQGVVIAQDNPVSVRFASRPMEEITGYSPQELTSFGPEQLVASIHPEDRPTFFRNFRARLAGQAVPARREYRLIHKNGETRWVEIHSSRIEYEGRPVTQTVFLDITERKLAEAERERLIQELQATLAQVKQLKSLLPICSSCKKIRDDAGYWRHVEVYIAQHAGVDFSHGLCPDCKFKLYPPDQYPFLYEEL